jgi:hypothetical protein
MKTQRKIFIGAIILMVIASAMAVRHLGIRVVITNTGAAEIHDLKLFAGSQSWGISVLKPGNSFRKVIFPKDGESVLYFTFDDATGKSFSSAGEYVEYGYKGKWTVDVTPQGVQKSQCWVRSGLLWDLRMILYCLSTN